MRPSQNADGSKGKDELEDAAAEILERRQRRTRLDECEGGDATASRDGACMGRKRTAHASTLARGLHPVNERRTRHVTTELTGTAAAAMVSR